MSVCDGHALVRVWVPLARVMGSAMATSGRPRGEVKNTSVALCADRVLALALGAGTPIDVDGLVIIW